MVIYSLKQTLESIKFSNGQPISTFPCYNQTLMDYGFLHEVKSFYQQCLNDFDLLEQSVDYLASHLFLVVEIYHMDAQCDIVCIDMLTLMAKTYAGASYAMRYKNKIMTQWQQDLWLSVKFRIKINVLVQTMKATIKAHDDAAELASQRLVINGVETVESLRMHHSSCGIFFNEIDFCISQTLLRRRINSLPSLHASMPREAFAGLFPKGCPGCVALNIFCAAEILSDTAAVHNVIKLLLNDPNGEIVSLDDVNRMCRRSRTMYKRSDDPYPFMGNCIDFQMRSDFVTWMELVGSLIKSPSFAAAMERDRAACVDYVRNQYFIGNGDHDTNYKVYNCEVIEEFCATILSKK